MIKNMKVSDTEQPNNGPDMEEDMYTYHCPTSGNADDEIGETCKYFYTLINTGKSIYLQNMKDFSDNIQLEWIVKTLKKIKKLVDLKDSTGFHIMNRFLEEANQEMEMKQFKQID